MPDECDPSYRCGTRAAGWLRGGHPSVHDGVVSRTVCYHWINDCCWRSNNILVRNCGGFFVYRLQKPPGFQYRYCGIGYTSKNQILSRFSSSARSFLIAGVSFCNKTVPKNA